MEPYALSRDSIERLARDMRRIEGQVAALTALNRSVRPRFVTSGKLRIAKTGQFGVTARSTFDAGSGTALLHTILNANGSFSATTTTITVYNIASSQVAADTFVLVEMDSAGKWWVIAEDCG